MGIQPGEWHCSHISVCSPAVVLLFKQVLLKYCLFSLIMLATNKRTKLPPSCVFFSTLSKLLFWDTVVSEMVIYRVNWNACSYLLQFQLQKASIYCYLSKERGVQNTHQIFEALALSRLIWLSQGSAEELQPIIFHQWNRNTCKVIPEDKILIAYEYFIQLKILVF